jgi:hypothetical protein
MNGINEFFISTEEIQFSPLLLQILIWREKETWRKPPP